MESDHIFAPPAIHPRIPSNHKKKIVKSILRSETRRESALGFEI